MNYTVQQVFTELINNPTALANGVQILTQCLSTNASFAPQAMELLVNPAEDANHRMYIGALIRHPLANFWSNVTDSGTKQVDSPHFVRDSSLI
jgi:hypothetical protein